MAPYVGDFMRCLDTTAVSYDSIIQRSASYGWKPRAAVLTLLVLRQSMYLATRLPRFWNECGHSQCNTVPTTAAAILVKLDDRHEGSWP